MPPPEPAVSANEFVVIVLVLMVLMFIGAVWVIPAIQRNLDKKRYERLTRRIYTGDGA